MRGIVDIPRVTVEVAGTALVREDEETLGEVRVQQRLSVPTLCELAFFDPRAAFASAATALPGAAVRVAVRGHQEPLFDGEVTAVEYDYDPSRGREIRVRCYDRLHRLRKRQPVRAHVQVTALDLARDLVSGDGLSVEAAGPGPLWQYLIQRGQSDLDLLAEVAEHCGLYVTLRGVRIHLLSLEGDGEPLPLVLSDSLLEARIELNGDRAYRSVSAAGWDPLRAEHHHAHAAQARVGREVAAEVAPDQLGSSGERKLVEEAAQDERHAEAIAQAELDVRVAGEVTLWGVAHGDPRLRPGARVDVRGVGEALAGRYVLTNAIHTIDQHRGFVTEISTAPPEPRVRVKGTVVTMGTVTRADDPEGRGRVRVSLPTYENVETPWMGVVGAGAGAGKGLVMLPDVGDPVLVLFAHEDPAQGVVLGSLYGVEVEDKGLRQYTLLTPGGQRVRLDDAHQTLRLENKEGSYFELSPQKVRLHAAVDLEIEAPGRNITIGGQAIDFQRR